MPLATQTSPRIQAMARAEHTPPNESVISLNCQLLNIDTAANKATSVPDRPQ